MRKTISAARTLPVDVIRRHSWLVALAALVAFAFALAVAVGSTAVELAALWLLLVAGGTAVVVPRLHAQATAPVPTAAPVNRRETIRRRASRHR